MSRGFVKWNGKEREAKEMEGKEPERSIHSPNQKTYKEVIVPDKFGIVPFN